MAASAGANWGAPIDEFPDAAFTKVMTLNVQRVFSLTQALLPLLSRGSRKSRSTPPSKSASEYDPEYAGPWEDPSRIIHIGSIDGLRVPNLETYSYSTSKAALHHLNRVLAIQLSPRGIISNTLACGPFQSKSTLLLPERERDGADERAGSDGRDAGQLRRRHHRLEPVEADRHAGRRRRCLPLPLLASRRVHQRVRSSPLSSPRRVLMNRSLSATITVDGGAVLAAKI